MKGRLRNRIRRTAAPDAEPDVVKGMQAPADEPCVPCGERRGVKSFALDPSVVRIESDDAPHPSPGLLEEITEHGVTLVDPTGTSHVLNVSAALVWLSIDGRS